MKRHKITEYHVRQFAHQFGYNINEEFTSIGAKVVQILSRRGHLCAELRTNSGEMKYKSMTVRSEFIGFMDY